MFLPLIARSSPHQHVGCLVFYSFLQESSWREVSVFAHTLTTRLSTCSLAYPDSRVPRLSRERRVWLCKTNQHTGCLHFYLLIIMLVAWSPANKQVEDQATRTLKVSREPSNKHIHFSFFNACSCSSTFLLTHLLFHSIPHSAFYNLPVHNLRRRPSASCSTPLLGLPIYSSLTGVEDD